MRNLSTSWRNMTITIDVGRLLIFIGLVCWSVVAYHYILRPIIIKIQKNRMNDEYDEEESDDGQRQT